MNLLIELENMSASGWFVDASTNPVIGALTHAALTGEGTKAENEE